MYIYIYIYIYIIYIYFNIYFVISLHDTEAWTHFLKHNAAEIWRFVLGTFFLILEKIVGNRRVLHIVTNTLKILTFYMLSCGLPKYDGRY